MLVMLITDKRLAIAENWREGVSKWLARDVLKLAQKHTKDPTLVQIASGDVEDDLSERREGARSPKGVHASMRVGRTDGCSGAALQNERMRIALK
jgi:hypothetical protein